MAVGKEPACISLPFFTGLSAPPFPGVGMHVRNRFPVIAQKESPCSNSSLNIRINLTFSIRSVRLSRQGDVLAAILLEIF